MKKTVLVYVCAILSSVILYSCQPSDAKIQKAVETTLTTTDLPVQSTVKDGVVTLTGTVDSEEAKVAAETAVKAIKDVKSISNNIEVKKAEQAVTINSDDTLSATINTALQAAGITGVSVEAKDGEVTLTGDIKKDDLAKVMQMAHESKPKNVVNKLNLK